VKLEILRFSLKGELRGINSVSGLCSQSKILHLQKAGSSIITFP
jgi:hypothetical protein